MMDALEKDAMVRRKFNAIVVFQLDQEEWYLDARKKGSSEKEKADLTVILPSAVLQDLIQQRVTPQQAFLKKKLKVKGKMALALKLKVVLDATRKQLQLANTSRL